MRRPQGSPLWLATPSRYAGWPAWRARVALGALLVLIVLCFPPPRAEPPPDAPVTAENKGSESDLALYETIVEDIRHGGDYYESTAHELRAHPGYPLRPFVTFRLPLLATVQAALPLAASLALLWMLALATALAWLIRLSAILPQNAPRVVAALLLAGGMVAYIQPALIASHEIWAALLIAWSMALRRPGRWIEAVALATIAMLVRETAALYVLVMGMAALVEGRRREAFGWAASLVVLAAVVAAHAVAVGRVTGPLDTVSDGWSGMNGIWFFAITLKHATILEMFSEWLVLPLVGLALFGWTVPRQALTVRMALTLAAYGALIGMFARLNNFYWGLMVAPVLLAGLMFVPDGLNDLIRASLDRRRITVTRTAR